jgi:hypothetical protein
MYALHWEPSRTHVDAIAVCVHIGDIAKDGAPIGHPHVKDAHRVPVARFERGYRLLPHIPQGREEPLGIDGGVSGKASTRPARAAVRRARGWTTSARCAAGVGEGCGKRQRCPNEGRDKGSVDPHVADWDRGRNDQQSIAIRTWHLAFLYALRSVENAAFRVVKWWAWVYREVCAQVHQWWPCYGAFRHVGRSFCACFLLSFVLLEEVFFSHEALLARFFFRIGGGDAAPSCVFGDPYEQIFNHERNFPINRIWFPWRRAWRQ